MFRDLLRATVLATAIGAATSAFALENTPYMRALSLVYEGYLGISTAKTTCESVHPEYREQNSQAYEAWLSQNISIVSDVESRLMQLVSERGANSSAVSSAMNSQREKVIASRREAFLQQSTESFKRQCQYFPELIKLDEADFSKHFAEELEIIHAKS